jgi:molybdate transport repressor ModE-like protein
MRTELRSLEWLLAVADTGSIGAAAKQLGVSQPSVTDRLQRLERHLHLALLDRSPRGTRLTAEGVAVAGWARHLLRASDSLEAGVSALRRQHDFQLRVSASMTVSEYLMPGWLAQLHLRSPQIGVALRMCNSQQVVQDVLGGNADLGFVEGPGKYTGLRTRTLMIDELVIVVAAHHPWARRRLPVDVAEFAQAPFIVRERGSGTRDTLDAALARAGARRTITPRLELASTSAIKHAVMTGQGVGVLSQLAVAEDRDSGRLREVRVQGVDLRRNLRVVWRTGSLLHGAAAELAACAGTGP